MIIYHIYIFHKYINTRTKIGKQTGGDKRGRRDVVGFFDMVFFFCYVYNRKSSSFIFFLRGDIRHFKVNIYIEYNSLLHIAIK